ncbi:MAG: class I mannose-6-phosphate isomerase [Actinomycetota bacterium]
MEPIHLPPNQLHRFYQGGARIASLRNTGTSDEYAPEEWIASMASPFGEPGVGIARLPDGRSLSDAVASEPDAFLGPAHVARYGSDVNVLIKLLDAGERLPVHLHPDDTFANAHLDSRYGKTEAWIILDVEPGASVQVGWRDGVTPEQLSEWVDTQDTDAMLAALADVSISPGATVYVPAGTPHAIGAGILLAELQQPTDFSLLLEYKGFADDIDGAFLGLGKERALEAVDYEPWTDDVVQWAVSSRGDRRPGIEALFPAEADPFFRAERIRPAPTRLPQEFSVLLVTDGSATATGVGWETALKRGDAVLVPFAAGPCELSGDAEIIRCMGPQA